MTAEPTAGNRWCCGTPTDNPANSRLAERIMQDLEDLTGFVVCRCTRNWACKDPQTVRRGDNRVPGSGRLKGHSGDVIRR